MELETLNREILEMSENDSLKIRNADLEVKGQILQSYLMRIIELEKEVSKLKSKNKSLESRADGLSQNLNDYQREEDSIKIARRDLDLVKTQLDNFISDTRKALSTGFFKQPDKQKALTLIQNELNSTYERADYWYV